METVKPRGCEESTPATRKQPGDDAQNRETREITWCRRWSPRKSHRDCHVCRNFLNPVSALEGKKRFAHVGPQEWWGVSHDFPVASKLRGKEKKETKTAKGESRKMWKDEVNIKTSDNKVRQSPRQFSVPRQSKALVTIKGKVSVISFPFRSFTLLFLHSNACAILADVCVYTHARLFGKTDYR